MTDEDDFPSHRPDLRRFDASLRCNICKEIYTTPVSLRCGHSFCSECLRNHLLYAQQHHFDVRCPECRQCYVEGDIRPILAFSKCTSLYKSLRSSLLDSVRPPDSPELSVGDPSGSESEICIGEKRVARQAADSRVPPVLHMPSITAVQLKKKLEEYKLSTEGNKQECFSRYRRFRSFVQRDQDSGRTRRIGVLAKLFQQEEKEKKNGPPVKLGGVLEVKTSQDLVNEINARRQRKKMSAVEVLE